MHDRPQNADKKPHRHGPGCGHTSIRHEGHIDYLCEGRLEHQEGDRIEEHRVGVTPQNPDRCTPEHACSHAHHGGHPHPNGERHHAHDHDGHHHEAIPHGDHVDVIHEGHLHHHHEGHCDDHGPVELAAG